MRGSIRRLLQLSVLALVMIVPMLVAAGPVLAADPLESYSAVEQSAHQINGRLVELSRKVFSETSEHVVYAVVSNDPRVSGIMDLWVNRAWVTEDGEVGFSGWWDMVTASGTWHADYYEGLESKGYLLGKPFRITVLPGVAVGEGGHEGLVLQYGAHKGAGRGATFIMKASIAAAE
jgi:hypothetical protein